MAKKEMRIKKKEMVYRSQKGVLKVRKLLSLQGHVCAHVDQVDPPDHPFLTMRKPKPCFCSHALSKPCLNCFSEASSASKTSFRLLVTRQTF